MQKRENLTIDDIAHQLGVSKTTVSRAISGKGRISSATRKKVQQYIQAHNYRPNVAAKALAEKKTYHLAFVIPREFINGDIPWIRQAMGAAAEEAARENYSLLLCMDDPNQLNKIGEYKQVDGVIFTKSSQQTQLIDLLSTHKLPYTAITPPPAISGNDLKFSTLGSTACKELLARISG